MLDHAFSFWIGRYSYTAIFFLLVAGIVGFPIPDQLVLLVSGYFVLTHALSLTPTLATAVLGSICGITLSYGMGRGLGCYLSKTGFGKRRLEHGQRLLDRFGNWALILGFFIPGVRNLIGIVPGMMRFDAARFARYAYPGAVISSIVCVFAGFLLGTQALWVMGSINRVLVACFLTIGSYVVYRRFSLQRASFPRNSK
jgi:membrane protein DedA with SNARE-associated domain